MTARTPIRGHRQCSDADRRVQRRSATESSVFMDIGDSAIHISIHFVDAQSSTQLIRSDKESPSPACA
jgi:hypothetical protein